MTSSANKHRKDFELQIGDLLVLATSTSSLPQLANVDESWPVRSADPIVLSKLPCELLTSWKYQVVQMLTVSFMCHFSTILQ
jgi:hypothetical protein